MKTMLLALMGAAVVMTTAPADAKKPKAYVCTQWKDGVCVSTHRVRGTPALAVGHVFGPTYTYTPVTALPQPVVSYYNLGPSYRYVYSDGYVYVVDPATYAITRVIDTIAH
jgi:hypothetical protein